MLSLSVSTVEKLPLLREYNSDVASRAYERTTRNESSAAGAPIQGINQGYNCIGADPQVAYVLSVGLAIGKYVHNFLQCSLQQGYAIAANRLAQQRSLERGVCIHTPQFQFPMLCVSLYPWRAQPLCELASSTRRERHRSLGSQSFASLLSCACAPPFSSPGLLSTFADFMRVVFQSPSTVPSKNAFGPIPHSLTSSTVCAHFCVSGDLVRVSCVLFWAKK